MEQASEMREDAVFLYKRVTLIMLGRFPENVENTQLVIFWAKQLCIVYLMLFVCIFKKASTIFLEN